MEDNLASREKIFIGVLKLNGWVKKDMMKMVSTVIFRKSINSCSDGFNYVNPEGVGEIDL